MLLLLDEQCVRVQRYQQCLSQALLKLVSVNKTTWKAFIIYPTPNIVHKFIWTSWMIYRKNIVRAVCKYCEKSLIRIGRKCPIYRIWFSWRWFSSEWLYGFKISKYRTNLCYFKSNICSGTILSCPLSPILIVLEFYNHDLFNNSISIWYFYIV